MKIILPIVVGSSLLISGWKPIEEREIYSFFAGEWTSVCIDELSKKALHAEEIFYLKDKRFVVKRLDMYGEFSYSGKYSISKDDKKYLIRHSDIISTSRNIHSNLVKEVQIGAKTFAISTYENSQCVVTRN